MLGEGPASDINGSFSSRKKRVSINFSKANTKFYLSLDCNSDNSLLVNGKEIYKIKADNKHVNFWTQFCLGSISNKFDTIDSREVSLTVNVHNFSVDYNHIDKSNILNIHKYLVVKNNTWNVWIF